MNNPETTPVMPLPDEREVFRYTSHDGRGVRVVVSGPVTMDTCEALLAFTGRRRAELLWKEDQDAR